MKANIKKLNLDSAQREPPQLLIEIRVRPKKIDPAKSWSCSLFAPVPRELFEQRHWWLDNSVAPVVQALDGLVEAFGRPPRFVLRVQDDGMGFRLMPAKSPVGAGLDAPSFFLDGPGVKQEITAIANSRLPGQFLFRFPKDWQFWDKPLRIRVVHQGGIHESHDIFLPAPARHDVEIAPLLPAESAERWPAPERLILDTLTLGTTPAHVFPQAAVAKDSWTAAERGILVTVINGAENDRIATFAENFLTARTIADHSRNWYLIASLVLPLLVWRYRSLD